MEEKGIPSPFWSPEDRIDTELLNDLEVIFRKHGYRQYAVMVAKEIPIPDGEVNWKGQSNILSDGLASYMRASAEWIEDFLNEQDDEE